jgi:protein arginine N-methyltransferase 2
MNFVRMDKDYPNDLFCMSRILFTNPNGAPEDEVALVTDPDGAGIMMEWERPISASSLC